MAGFPEVVAALNASMDPLNATRNAAEAQLMAMSKLPIWPTGLMSIIGDAAQFPQQTRLAAALALKRATREHWHNDAPQADGAPSSPYPAEVKDMGALPCPWRVGRPSAPPPLQPSRSPSALSRLLTSSLRSPSPPSLSGQCARASLPSRCSRAPPSPS